MRVVQMRKKIQKLVGEGIGSIRIRIWCQEGFKENEG